MDELTNAPSFKSLLLNGSALGVWFSATLIEEGLIYLPERFVLTGVYRG